ncbi:unnamed protein product, partial [Adineta steineri]
MLPLYNEVVPDQEEDKSVSQTFLKQINNDGNYRNIINSNNTNINPLTIAVGNKNILSSKSKEIQPYFHKRHYSLNGN